jgi:hypothetical protein
MKAEIESTEQVVEVGTGDVGGRGRYVSARVWTGRTARGVPVQMLVLHVAVAKDADSAQFAEFEADLKETPAPRPEAMAFPLRMVL